MDATLAGVVEGTTGVEGLPDDSRLAEVVMVRSAEAETAGAEGFADCLTTEDQVGGVVLLELTSEELLDETASVRPTWEVVMGGTGVNVLSDWLRTEDRAEDLVHSELSAVEL